MISFICTGRDDDYEFDFLDRLTKSICTNCSLLECNNINYEYIIVEWNPFRDYLAYNNKTRYLFLKFNLKDLVISKSVVQKESLPNDRYFEYFAKNAGIRRSKGDIVIVLNSDICLTDRLVKTIKKLTDSGLDPQKFYRTRYRQKQFLNEPYPHEQTDLHNATFPDAEICGGYSGDFMMVCRSSMMDIARGYNEEDDMHRVTYQTGCDGEILWNMYNKGMKLEFINDPYIHLEHGKSRQYDGYRMYAKYDNKPNWGFVDYESEEVVPGKLEVIK